MFTNSIDNIYEEQVFIEGSSLKLNINSIQPIVSINTNPYSNLEFKDRMLRAPNQNDGEAATDTATPYQLTIQEKILELWNQPDQFEDQRQNYIIKSVGDKDSQKLFWQNDEGTKCIMLEQWNQSLDKNLTLFDLNFRQIQTVEYRFDKDNKGTPTLITSFTISHDELFMAMQDENDNFYFCQFENGMEHDLFVDQDRGKISFQQMSKMLFELKQKGRSIDFKISKHLFVFADRKTIYKSKKTVFELLQDKGNSNKIISFENDFQKVDNPVNQLVIGGPFAFGIDLKKCVIYAYDCYKDKNFSYKLENENEQLTEDTLIQPSFQNNCFTYYFYVIGKQKLDVFHFENEEIKFDYSLAYPSSNFSLKPIKIISMEMIVCQDDEQIYLYQINLDQNKVVFSSKIKALDSSVLDVMKQSSLLYDSKKNQLYNLYKSPLDYHQKFKILNQNPEKNEVIGINCFDEILTYSDFHAFAHQCCPQIDSPQLFKDIIFYSKRLKIVIINNPMIYDWWVVYYLDSSEQLRFENGNQEDIIVKSIAVSWDQEFARIFSKNQANTNLTCLTILNNFRLEKTIYELDEEQQSKIQVSVKGDKVAVLINKRLLILSVNSNNQFEKIFDEPANDKISEDFKFLNDIIISNQKVYRLQEKSCDSLIPGKSSNLINLVIEDIVKGYHYEQINNEQINKKLLMIINESNIFIYDLIDSGLKIIIKNTNFDFTIIQNFGKNDFDGVFYNCCKNLYSHQIVLCRVQICNSLNEIMCGIPFNLAIKDNLTCFFDIKSLIIQYYQFNQDSIINQNNYVSRIELKYRFDLLSEYADYDDDNKLLDRENEVIENIEKNSSILALTSFNVLHNTFYLNTMQEKPEFKNFFPHIFKRLQLINEERAVPYMMVEDKNWKTPLSKAIENEDISLVKNIRNTPLSKAIEAGDISIVTNILELLIKTDIQGILYSKYTAQFLLQFKEMGIDLKPFFNSGILIHKVDQKNKKFISIHANPQHEVCHSDKENLQELLNTGYDNQLIEQGEGRLRHNIEYKIVNMKAICGQDRNSSYRNLIQLIDELSDIDLNYLDIEVLQVIINYKWKTYTKTFFVVQFIFLLILLCSFIVGLYVEDDLIYKSIQISILVLLVPFFCLEIAYICTSRLLNYFKSFWNICDFLIPILYSVYSYYTYDVPNKEWTQKYEWMECSIIILLFIKFLFCLRIFEQFSFLVQMFSQVFRDLTYFIFFFIFVLIFFSGLLVITIYPPKYQGLGFVSLFALALRQSIGDYEKDDYFIEGTFYGNDAILIWLIWLIIMAVGNVIFMNFIIAVVSQSYENCMNQSELLQFKVKCNMIREYESIMMNFNRQKWFPNFIIVRNSFIDSKDGSSDGSLNEWKGILREMQRGVKKQIDALKQEQKKVLDQFKKKMTEDNESQKKLLEELKDLLTQKK